MTSLRVNGRVHEIEAPGGTRLLDVLREQCGLLGTREGCGAGECGACQVLLDGRPVASCDLPWSAVGSSAVTTVEGLGATREGAAMRRAFVAEQAAQCGFCSSGLLVAATALLMRDPRPGDVQVRQALDGHLCRCGVHNRLLRAVQRAAADLAR